MKLPKISITDDKNQSKRSDLDDDVENYNSSHFNLNFKHLNDLVENKSYASLKHNYKGVAGLSHSLKSDLSTGLSDDKDDNDGLLNDRVKLFGRNVLPKRKTKNLFQLMWLAMEDKILQLLIVAALVSLALGIYQSVGFPPSIVRCYNDQTGRYDGYCEEPRVEWVEGLAIIIAILIVVLVGSGNDYQKELQFIRLNKKKDDRFIKVKRNNTEQSLNVHDILVGDILYIETGDILPVDGIFSKGHNLKSDESSLTGESDAIKKLPYDLCNNSNQDCFLLSGSKITQGFGEMLVISVGVHSSNGKILASLNDDDDEVTPLQQKLNYLAELIAKVASIAGLLLFIALMIRFFVNLKEKPNRTARDKGQDFIQVLIISVTLIVVAVPEGLPLAVTLALAFATKRMTKAKLLVRLLASCETMANATVICTDKTGTLTQNVMTVVAGTMGLKAKFVYRLDDNSQRSNADEINNDKSLTDGNFSIDIDQISNHVKGDLKKLLFDSIAINSTAFEEINRDNGQLEFVGSKTETALLRFIKSLNWFDWKETRDKSEIVQMIPFSSERKCMGVVIKLNNNKYRLYLKGASEVLVKNCKKTLLVEENKNNDGDINLIDIGDVESKSIDYDINFLANQSLRTLAICYRDFDSWPPEDSKLDENDDVDFNSLNYNLNLISITGIEDPLRVGVSNAVKQAQDAGVKVKMCTGDNIITAQSIAKQCGILTDNGIVMEGSKFRELSDFDRINTVQNLQVLARSSPDDKKLLVSTLKNSHNETVGVTGDGTNDAPALKAANVGFSMGIAGTEVAKEASSIILMDDNFASIVSAIMWGRCVNDSVKKFLQFQLSVNVTAIIITFVTAIASDSEESVLSAVQLLWVNLIMDTFAALALATDPASQTVLNRKPDLPRSPIISTSMIKVIVSQSIYKTAVAFVLHFAGRQILGYRLNYSNEEEEAEYNEQGTELKTLVFNAFVWCQIFNQINCRRLDNKLNVFEGIHRNLWFIVIFCIMCGGQILIVFVGGAAFSVKPINGRDWAISIICGLCSLIIGALVRFIPDKGIERKLIDWKVFPDPNVLPINNKPSQKGEDPVYDSLQVLSALRGGRIKGSSFVQKSRKIVRHPIQQISESMHLTNHSRSSGQTTPENQSQQHLSPIHNHLDALSVLPMMVASSVGAGPAYRSSRSGSITNKSDLSKHSPSNSFSYSNHSPNSQHDELLPPSPLR